MVSKSFFDPVYSDFVSRLNAWFAEWSEDKLLKVSSWTKWAFSCRVKAQFHLSYMQITGTTFLNPLRRDCCKWEWGEKFETSEQLLICNLSFLLYWHFARREKLKQNIEHSRIRNLTLLTFMQFNYCYTAVSTKVVPRKCKSVRDNVDWHCG